MESLLAALRATGANVVPSVVADLLRTADEEQAASAPGRPSPPALSVDPQLIADMVDRAGDASDALVSAYIKSLLLPWLSRPLRPDWRANFSTGMSYVYWM